ncbi:sugar phosphate isomerase/epimerase [Cellulophaga sp. HaHa_2_1]|uniref:sugar phosphate isomerase/epimerase family protein n=1 Tax=Cellulophaga sp. HaHa_2_1 TaxID=2749994 RepID=UPI001C4FF04F|nr:TIM barrel protein [Cellulophaga sp. HaHa_2_1]QXP52598.1 TIM barrel protein [Cellulophaga sp. HaHa_2_1]
MNNLSREAFLKLSAMGLAAIPLVGMKALEDVNVPALIQVPRVHLFSKHLQFLDYDKMSRAAAELGFDGLDVTVRKGGHVTPENVARDLPKIVQAMQSYGLTAELITTNITTATAPETENILYTASQLGFKNYRMGWLEYSEALSIPESIEKFEVQFAALEFLNKKLNITGSYQNHAGQHVGAPVWDIHQIIKDRDPNYIATQYDIRHAVVEGGTSWTLGLRLIQSHIKCIVIKDFKWGQEHGVWKPINVPLGEGMVDFNAYFKLLKKYHLDNIPMSLHCEYNLGGAEHGDKEISISEEAVLKRIKKDLNFLKNAWQHS